MEIMILSIFILAIYVFIKLIQLFANSTVNKSNPPKQRIPLEYNYLKKKMIMTRVENEFYLKLKNIIGSEYSAIPQAHLSTFLDHKVYKQNWKGAFRKINGKSIDFLVCKNNGMEPICAIELDDYTHSQPDRVTRDEFVNASLEKAGIPLVRFREGEWSDNNAIFEKIKLVAGQKNSSEPRI